MRRNIGFFSLVFIALFFHLSVGAAQEKVDAPVWNVGDKWIFSNEGIIEVVDANQNTYVLRFSDDICVAFSRRFNAIVFDKSTFHRIYGFEGDERKKYTRHLRKIFDFPLSHGKQWKDEEIYETPIPSVFSDLGEVTYFESFKVLGWEDIEVQAGKFRAIKLAVTGGEPPPAPQQWGANLYWYSPEAKYFVKCQYDPDIEATFKEYVSWELSSFKVKK